MNFDIDVCVQNSSSHSRSVPSFIVAHPSSVKSMPHLPYQTISSFLNQIATKYPDHLSNLSSNLIYPFVTIEPKFDDMNYLIQLLDEVMSTQLGQKGHTAIIIRELRVLREVEEFYTKYFSKADSPKIQPIAIAYRSQSPGANDLRWTLSGSQESPYSLPKHTSTSLSISFKQIHMPDIKLFSSTDVPNTSKYQKVLPFATDRYKRVRDRDVSDSVVAWIVDTEESMWDMLTDMSTDMIITNHPIQMLEKIQEFHQRECSSR